MIKNLGKFKQWTGERFGGAKVTLQTDDFLRLEHETELRRKGYDYVVEATDTVQDYLLKKKSSPDDKSKTMPFQILGTCLFDYGKVFPEDSALGIALINLGQAESKIAALQESLASDIRMGYLTTLEEGNRYYKEYDHLKKKLVSRRLDYDAKLNRLSKAKKEKPELEQEMQASRMKYEDTEHELIQKMAYLQEFEHDHRDALFGLLEAQLNYHNQAKELLLTIHNNWGAGSFSDPFETMGTIMNRTESYHSVSEDNISTTETDRPRRQRTASTDSSDFSYAQSQISEADTPPSRVSSVRQASYDIPNEKYRKAMFDFNSNNDDEISFKTGDLIRVISEIDKGWWVGEVHNERGIFPVNFTEEHDARSQQPLPSLPTSTNNISSASINNSIKSSRSNTSAIYNESSSPPSSSSNNISSSSLLQRANTSPHIPTTTTANTSSQSLSRKHSTAIRPPPPPPAKAQPSSPSSSVDSFSIVPNSNSPPVRSQSPTSFHENHTSEYNIDTRCPECDCHQFIANSVKKGYCNTCYHKHIQ